MLRTDGWLSCLYYLCVFVISVPPASGTLQHPTVGCDMQRLQAEAQCAWLNAEGLVDGVVTDDNDVFLFGGRHVYRNIFDNKRYASCLQACHATLSCHTLPHASYKCLNMSGSLGLRIRI